MEIICAISLVLFILFIVTLLTDLFDSLNVLYSFSLICSLISCLENSDNQTLLLNTLSHPILILLTGLAIFSFVFQHSVFLVKITQYFSQFKNQYIFMFSLLTFSGLASSILNNALIVSSLIPLIKTLCKDNGWKLKCYLLPLSFVSMLGGTITLIGSSTNLVALSLLEPEIKIGILDLTKYSFPTAIAGIAYLILASKLLNTSDNGLPNCCTQLENNHNIDIQLKFLKIGEESHLTGKSIRETQIQELHGLQLCGIQRGDVFSATPPRSFTVIQPNDILTFVGCLNTTSKQNNLDENGLVFLDEKLLPKTSSPNIAIGRVPKYFSSIANQKGKDLKFKQTYNFVLLAIIRNQVFITHELTDQTLLPDDFIVVHGLFNKTDLEVKLAKICTKVYVLSGVDNDDTPSKNPIMGGILLVIIFTLIIISGLIDILNANNICLVAIPALLVLQVIQVEGIKYSIGQFKNVILGTMASLLLTKNLHLSGVLDLFAQATHYFDGVSNWYVYFIYHLIASGLSSIISNVAVVSILIPIVKLSYLNDERLLPIVYCLIHGASCCFISPTGYHTNLMVHNIGNYNCRDYLKLGLPLNFLTSFLFASFVYYL